jgi:hypothetical protein
LTMNTVYSPQSRIKLRGFSAEPILMPDPKSSV